MAGSGFTIKLTSMALNAVIKLSNADLRIHGEKNIPDEPSVFVINHFTRMETFLIPFVLTKTTEKEIISLAHHSFFGGGFGRFLEKLGAVSTNDPDRDRKMIGALLRGDAHCMIFPEGQMIKDKKIVEKGKFMILWLFTTDGIAAHRWQTIRRWTPEKEAYYRKHVGEAVRIEVT